MIRALLVDAGGVLFNNVTEETDFLARLAGRHGVDPNRLRDHIDQRDAAYEIDARHVHDVLQESLAAAADGSAVRLNCDWVDAQYLDCVHPYRIAFDALADLRRAHPNLVLALANNEAAHWDLLKDSHFGHLGLFDVVGSSWRLGAVKPTADYLDRLLDLCRCGAGDALLVDDNPEVIDSAAWAGLRVLHLTRPERLASTVSIALGTPTPADEIEEPT